MSNLFWLTDEQLTAIEEAIPKNRRGVKPKRNREVISGIIHVLKVGSRWEDCPAEHGLCFGAVPGSPIRLQK